MKKCPLLLLLFALGLPISVFAQPDHDRDAPRDRPAQHDRDERHNDRPDRPDRPRHDDRQDQDRPQRPGPHEAISVEQIDEAIATLRAMHPDTKLNWLERLEKMAKDNPEEAAKRLSRFPRLGELMDLRQNKPEAFELHATQSRLMREFFPLVRQARQAQQEEDQAKADELKAQLREHIEQLFEVRLKLKAFEIERIRKQLHEAEEELAKIKGDRDKLIDEKLNELMQRSERPDKPERPDLERSRPERDEP